MMPCEFDNMSSNNVEPNDRGVAKGGSEGPQPPLNLADQLILFIPRGADYTPHTTASTPPPRVTKSYLQSTPLNERVFLQRTDNWLSIY